jgi:hypothetical protein
MHKGICALVGKLIYINTTLSYAANLTLHGHCGWHQLVNFIRT